MEDLHMKKYTFDFYNSASLKAYNLNQTMRYQLSILNKMDPFTKRHSENVGNLVCRICEYLHFNHQIIIHSTICAYLHDIGKLRIPPEILQKPAKLTDEEYEIIKTHTTIGYEMCMSDINLRPYAKGALYHHEALNGTGYPYGLTKKDIPYIAQINRVADEYDAIVTKRQYKTHINISETLRELIKDALPEEHIKLVALDQLKTNKKLGKINPRILKILFKVVIDDIIYEIATIFDYVEYIKTELKRFDSIELYYSKMEKATKEKDKSYYAEGIKMLLAPGETFENFHQVKSEYLHTKVVKEDMIKKLYDEIKIINKLKVR